jgi:acyl-CoA synthetase (AMP-forming)/AMP-acid ligase II
VSYKDGIADTYGISNLPEAPIFTGDTGYITGNTLFITGRKKHLGKVRGFTVNTQVLEHFLQQHHGIEDAVAMIENGELLVRVVAPTLSIHEVATSIELALPAHYMPGKIALVSILERTETGKIIRHNAETK